MATDTANMRSANSTQHRWSRRAWWCWRSCRRWRSVSLVRGAERRNLCLQRLSIIRRGRESGRHQSATARSADSCLGHKGPGNRDRHLKLRRLCTDLERFGRGCGGWPATGDGVTERNPTIPPGQPRSSFPPGSRSPPGPTPCPSTVRWPSTPMATSGPGPQCQRRPVPVRSHGIASK